MRKLVKVTGEYLLFPIRAEEDGKIVSVHHGEDKVYQFVVPVGKEQGAYSFHYYAAVPVAKWKGDEIVVEGEVPENFLEAVTLSNELPWILHKKPFIHFSPNTGWLNDPNGMIYQDGAYHLFFQHNPCDTRWQNLSWGHAVSRDLLHWEQKEDIVFPDEDGTMFSGCGIVNEQERLGLPKDAEIFFYTCAGGTSEWSKGKKFVQRIAYSTDHGVTFHKKKGNVLEHIEGDNRDPKVYWYEAKQLYYMVLYLDKNEYAVFNSTDLEHWEITQRLTLPLTWECPDLREVPIEGGGSKWMFWGSDGYYFLGDFDGSYFETDGIRHEGYQTMLPYAAQSFWGTERVIMIPWMRTCNEGRLYTGVMGLPRQLTLVKKGDDLLLRQKPVDEFEESKTVILTRILSNEIDNNGVSEQSPSLQEELVFEQEAETALEVKLFPEKDAGFRVNLYGTVCSMEQGSGCIRIEGVAGRSNAVENAAKSYDKEKISSERAALKHFSSWKIMSEGISWEKAGVRILETGCGIESVSFLSDGEILEITVDDGLICAAYETKVSLQSGQVRVKAYGKVKTEISQIK